MPTRGAGNATAPAGACPRATVVPIGVRWGGAFARRAFHSPVDNPVPSLAADFFEHLQLGADELAVLEVEQFGELMGEMVFVPVHDLECNKAPGSFPRPCALWKPELCRVVCQNGAILG